MEQKKKATKPKVVQKNQKTDKTEHFEKRVNLENAIKNKGLSNKKLGALVGLSDRQIGHYVNGTRNIPIDNLKKISEVLEVSTDYILGKTNQPDLNLLSAIRKDATRKTLSIYKTMFDLLDDIGIKFTFKEENNALYMEPKGYEPIYIDSDMYWFFVKHIRKYAFDIFMEYYNSVPAFKDRLQHARDLGTADTVVVEKKEGDADDLTQVPCPEKHGSVTTNKYHERKMENEKRKLYRSRKAADKEK